MFAADTTIEAPPSVIPHKHLCDITGLEARYLRSEDECFVDKFSRPPTQIQQQAYVTTTRAYTR